MHKEHITELPAKYGEYSNPLKNALKKLILEKPDVLPGCRLADEIREEIANEKQEETGDDIDNTSLGREAGENNIRDTYDDIPF